MREIKFRAFYKPLSRMIESEKVESINFDTKTVGIYTRIENAGFHNFRMSDFEVMQYTGLHDKNGNEIYEGDIVRYPDAYMNTGDWEEVVNVGEIKWDCAQFYVTNRESIDNDDFWEQIDECEIIGNIYEHQHLIEGAAG